MYIYSATGLLQPTQQAALSINGEKMGHYTLGHKEKGQDNSTTKVSTMIKVKPPFSLS
jgi:hypothetical protein